MKETKPENPSGHRPGTASPFSAADLPLDAEGCIYHLQLFPEQIAQDIILVGDPGRAEMIGATYLTGVTCRHQHRGLVTVTGTAAVSGERATVIGPLDTSVVTSGIGTPSLEIVAQELVILNEIDFTTRTRKAEFPRLHFLRVGTSGGLQAATPLGTPVITSYAIGMDNTGLYYQSPHPDEHCARIESDLHAQLKNKMDAADRFYGRIHPYVSRAAPELVDALVEAAEQLDVPVKLGLTASCSGFFAPQGRDIARVRPSVFDIDQVLAEFDPKLDGQRVENMEMEASFLLHLMGGLGYWAGAICPAIANRRADTFDSEYQESVRKTTEIALLALANLRKRYPDVRLG
jgi:uridine phosphorylase